MILPIYREHPKTDSRPGLTQALHVVVRGLDGTHPAAGTIGGVKVASGNRYESEFAGPSAKSPRERVRDPWASHFDRPQAGRDERAE
jgi:hypothetical protein